MLNVETPQDLASYFGITERMQQNAQVFFEKVRKKLPAIYDASARRGSISQEAITSARKAHIQHLALLLSSPHKRSTDITDELVNTYLAHNTSPVQISRLYQVLLSHLCGEAHKLYWWRYKKYRDINRTLRALLIMDLGSILQHMQAAHADSPYSAQKRFDTLLNSLLDRTNTLVNHLSATHISSKSSPDFKYWTLEIEDNIKKLSEDLQNIKREIPQEIRRI